MVLLLNADVLSALCAVKNPHSRTYKLATSNLKDLHFSHPTYAGLAPFHSSIADHQIRQFKIRQQIFVYTELVCRVYIWVCVIVQMRK